MPSAAHIVAIVDDEESVRKALGRLVRSAGFGADTFSSGIDFLRSLRQRQPNCVVLDLRMPHMNGFELQEMLARDYAHLPVVIVTGDDSPASRERALRQGAVACLGKPVDDVMLVDAIEAAIRSRGARG